MKKKISYILALPLLSVFLITEINNLNGEQESIAKPIPPNPGAPYIIDSPDTITIVPNSATQDSVKIEMTVYDNEAQDFYNYQIGNSMLIEWSTFNGGSAFTHSTLLTDQSDIDNNKYVFEELNTGSPLSSIWETQMTDLNNPHFKYRKHGIKYLQALYTDGTEVGGIHDMQKATLKSTDDIGFTAMPSSKENFSEVYVNGVSGQDSIYNLSYHDGTITFQVNGENLENTPDGNLDIVLEDSKGNYGTYEAVVTDQSTNTYSITGLTDSSYEFISIVNSDITIDPDGNNETYTPMSTVNFVDDLGMSARELSVEDIENPYINDDGLTITDTTSVSSIQFTLSVVDNAAGDFTNNLTENANILNVTLSENGATATSYQATWQGDSANNIYTFEIDNLDPNTSYEIISINNSGLAVGSSSLAVDHKILVEDELHSDGTFVTGSGQTEIVDNGSFNLLWLLIPLILIIIIAAGAGTYFFKNKKSKA